VLALRSVEFDRNHGVPVHVRQFTWAAGTWIEERRTLEGAIVRG